MNFIDPNDPLSSAKQIVEAIRQQARIKEDNLSAELIGRITDVKLTPLVLAIVTRALEAALLQVRSESLTGVRGRMAPIGFHRSDES